MRPQTRDEVVSCVRDVLKGFPDIRLALVYGSAARNQLRDHSDVDVAVGAGVPLSWEVRINLQLVLSDALQRSVDLIDLETLTGLLWELLWTEGVYVLRDHDLIVKYTGKAQSFVEEIKPGMMEMIEYRLAKEFGPL